MAPLRLLADEHVDSAYVTVLRSNGYDVATVGPGYEPGTDDEELLELAVEDGRVVLTNDRDFVELARTCDHPGVFVFEQGTPAGRLGRAIERVDRYVPADERENALVWLGEWID